MPDKDRNQNAQPEAVQETSGTGTQASGADTSSEPVAQPEMEVKKEEATGVAEKVVDKAVIKTVGETVETKTEDPALQKQPEQHADSVKTQPKGLLEKLRAKWQAHVEKNKAQAATKKTGKDTVPEETDGVPEKKLTPQEKQELIEAEKRYRDGMASIRDLIAPSAMDIQYRKLQVGGMYTKSFFVYSYPRFIDTNWLSPIINFDTTLDMAQFIYPIDSAEIMKVLKKKVAQMQSTKHMQEDRGQVRDPALETALEDAEILRTEIQRGQERFFQFALYFTVYSENEEELEKVSKQLESLLGGKLVLTKTADLRMEQAFHSCLPMASDELEVLRNMNTSPLSSTFPFSSSELTSNEGILYGLNRHNDSLIIFDRFKLENANSVVFAKSGAGKSYAVKLEILRSMMLGTDVIVIDPENEYKALADTVGGSYLRVSLNADRRINPFDLPKPLKDEVLQPGDILRSAIINLSGLLRLMLGKMTPEEEGIVDRALIDTYNLKGITMDQPDPSEKEPPTMQDLYDVLNGMEGAKSLSQRLHKYTNGTYAGIFNKSTNIDLNNQLMVFSMRDLEDELRPVAMYIILNYIWNQVRSKLKKRLLVVDEAWTMMQYEDSAKFMYGLVKRARKYYLGVTTITQDVEDFLKSSYGKPIITNSSMQMLLKQSPSIMDELTKIFNLTEGEKYLLLNSGVGQGLFFAGLKHVAIQIIASYTEDKLITTNPEELLQQQEAAAATLTMTEDAEKEVQKQERATMQQARLEEEEKLNVENGAAGAPEPAAEEPTAEENNVPSANPKVAARPAAETPLQSPAEMQAPPPSAKPSDETKPPVV